MSKLEGQYCCSGLSTTHRVHSRRRCQALSKVSVWPCLHGHRDVCRQNQVVPHGMVYDLNATFQGSGVSKQNLHFNLARPTTLHCRHCIVAMLYVISGVAVNKYSSSNLLNDVWLGLQSEQAEACCSEVDSVHHAADPSGSSSLGALAFVFIVNQFAQPG